MRPGDRPKPYRPTELAILEEEFDNLGQRLQGVLARLYPIGSKAQIITPTGWYLGTVVGHMHAASGYITIKKFNGRLHDIE